MNNTMKIYMLTLISFFVGSSQFSIVGMLDKIAASTWISAISVVAAAAVEVLSLGRIRSIVRVR